MKKAVIITVLFLTACRAFAGYGGQPDAFLMLGSSPRATGMGSAFTAIADDCSAAFYNPAGLTQLSSLQFMAETYFLTFGRNMNYLSLAKPFLIDQNTYSYGISWINYSAGSNIEARATNSPNPDSTFSDTTNIFTGSAALRISKSLSLGVNAKYLMHNISQASSNGFCFDIGLLLELMPGLRVGASFENIGSDISWAGSSANESIPATIATGISYSFKNLFNIDKTELTADGDILYNTFGPARFNAGVEARIDAFCIRLGYDNGLTAGAGVCFVASKVFDIKADYAFTIDPILPDSINNRLGITLDFVFPSDIKGGVQGDQIQEQKDGQINSYRLNDDW